MTKSKTLSVTLLVLLSLISFAVVAQCYASAATLTSPSASMKSYEGQGFTVKIPSNWSADIFSSGTYFAAADGKRVTKDVDGTTVSILLGFRAGYLKTTSSTARDAADKTIRSYQKDNPGLRVTRREARKLGSFPAESVLFESATGHGGELERSWMLIAVKGSQQFLVIFTSPARDYDRLQSVFVQIIDSIRLTAWQKGTATKGRSNAPVPMKR
jgi:hypothetical protein